MLIDGKVRGEMRVERGSGGRGETRKRRERGEEETGEEREQRWNDHQGNLSVLKCLCKKYISGNQKGVCKDVISTQSIGRLFAVRLFF